MVRVGERSRSIEAASRRACCDARTDPHRGHACGGWDVLRSPLNALLAVGPGWARQGPSHCAPEAADRAGPGATAAHRQRRLDPVGPARRRDHYPPQAQRASDRGRLPAKRIGGTGAVDTAVTTSSALRSCHFASCQTPATGTKAVSLFRGVCEPRLTVWCTAHLRLDVAHERG
jgi:hypothetical protein